MIAANLRFGSYERADATDLFRDYLADDEGAPKHVSSCGLPDKWTALRLSRIEKYNHDVSLFTFELPAGLEALNLPLGAYLLLLTPKGDIRPYTSVSAGAEERGRFTIMVKRYDEWGTKEAPHTHFLFTKTDHTYKPPGVVSSYIHGLRVGDSVSFKHAGPCIGKLGEVFDERGRCVTMICVGIGVAPMVQSLAALFTRPDRGIRVVLIYGVRRAEDILMRALLEQWAEQHSERFRMVLCVGSRYSNVHMGAAAMAKGKATEYVAPPDLLAGVRGVALQGWVTEAVIAAHAFPCSDPRSRVLVCGLPGVYLKICGPRLSEELAPGSALYNLGFSKQQVIKL